MKKAQEEDFKVEGMTHRIFWTFVCVSVLAIIYFNVTELDDLKRLTAKFPELSKTVKNTFLHTYKVAAPLALVFADIILVGPFAYLSYFSDHIKPKPGKLINALSFFDLGLLSALILTFGERTKIAFPEMRENREKNNFLTGAASKQRANYGEGNVIIRE